MSTPTIGFEASDAPPCAYERAGEYEGMIATRDQPVPMRTRSAQSLWSIPYPQELNDIPMIMARQLDAKDFAQMIIDQFDEMLLQSKRQALVMGIALHPYIVGQPYRLKHLRRALQYVAQARDQGQIWLTTPGAIHAHMVEVNRA